MDLIQWTSIVMCLIFSRQCGCSRFLNGKNQHSYSRIRRNIFSCNAGINIFESMREGPPFVNGSSHLENHVDSHFRLPCYAFSRTLANITWLKDGSTLSLGQNNDQCEGCVINLSPGPPCAQELHIPKAEQKHSGVYTCLVTNEFGSSEFNTTVKVIGQPRERLSIAKIRLQSVKQKAILGGSIVVACTIHCPKRIRGIWKKNGKRATDDGKRLIWNTTGLVSDEYEKKMYLHLKNITVKDEGNYTCFVAGGEPRTFKSKTLTLKTVPCPAGHYCPWTENQAYPCPYGTYTNSSSNSAVLTAYNCFPCPDIPQDAHPKGKFQPATSLGHCPAANNSCALNHYCPNRMTKIPCPPRTYFDGRNASDESDCKKCPNDTKEWSQKSANLMSECFTPTSSSRKRQDNENRTRTDIVAGVLGGITFVFASLIIVASFYLKRRAQTNCSLYKSNYTSPQVALEKFHKKSCPHHQDGYTFDPSKKSALLAAKEDAIPTLYDVFITYSSMDGDWVKNLVSVLESRGLKCCVDYRDFLPGNAIVTNITEAIYQSRRTLAILSPDYIKSNWCQSELQHALARVQNHKVVPVLYRACAVPIELKSKTYIDWENPDVRPHFWDTLERTLKEKPIVCSCIAEEV